MDILLRQVRVIDPSSPFHQQTIDIFIQNGVIAETGNLSRSHEQEVNIPGLCVSPGWLDIFSQFWDPGFEYKETLQTGAATAAAGGFTDVMILPNTNPVLHNKAGVEYIVQKSKFKIRSSGKGHKGHEGNTKNTKVSLYKIFTKYLSLFPSCSLCILCALCGSKLIFCYREIHLPLDLSWNRSQLRRACLHAICYGCC